MKNFITLSILIVFTFVGTTFAQCDTKNVELNNEFSLSAKQMAYVQTDKLNIEFVSVLNDSRCAPDVNCIWAGSAKIQIKVSQDKAAAEVFELNTNLDPKFITFQGYKIELTALTPTPKSNIDRKTVNYEASFIVRK
ncbi:hypothetical protein BH10ACI1_BH10ACI1_16150 [soil metagenome]